ncbi:hypothetical protein EBR66_01570 [bacterium]|nr:hypothetical protein [bacterium]
MDESLAKPKKNGKQNERLRPINRGLRNALAALVTLVPTVVDAQQPSQNTRDLTRRHAAPGIDRPLTLQKPLSGPDTLSLQELVANDRFYSYDTVHSKEWIRFLGPFFAPSSGGGGDVSKWPAVPVNAPRIDGNGYQYLNVIPRPGGNVLSTATAFMSTIGQDLQNGFLEQGINITEKPAPLTPPFDAAPKLERKHIARSGDVVPVTTLGYRFNPENGKWVPDAHYGIARRLGANTRLYNTVRDSIVLSAKMEDPAKIKMLEQFLKMSYVMRVDASPDQAVQDLVATGAPVITTEKANLPNPQATFGWFGVANQKIQVGKHTFLLIQGPEVLKRSVIEW